MALLAALGLNLEHFCARRRQNHQPQGAEGRAEAAEAKARRAEARAIAAEAAVSELQKECESWRLLLVQQVAGEEGNSSDPPAVQRLRLALREADALMAQKTNECVKLHATLKTLLEAFHCPILQELWEDPVVASDGHTYERRAIQQWMQKESTSPLTRDHLQPQLYPNRFAKTVLWQVEGGLCDDLEEADSAAPVWQDNGEPPPASLLEALKLGRKDTAMTLLRKSQVPGINLKDEFGCSVLHLAIEAKFLDVALAILSKPEFHQVNSTTLSEWTPLHAAAHHGLLPVCSAIMERADFKDARARDISGRSASEMARLQGHPRVALFIEQLSLRRFFATP